MCDLVLFGNLCFMISNNPTEATKNICGAKGVSTVDHITVTKLFEKFYSGYKNLDDLSRSGRPTSLYSKTLIQFIDANPVSSTRKVSSELHISQYSIVYHLDVLSRSKLNCQIVLHVTKPLQNFWLTLVKEFNANFHFKFSYKRIFFLQLNERCNKQICLCIQFIKMKQLYKFIFECCN